MHGTPPSRDATVEPQKWSKGRKRRFGMRQPNFDKESGPSCHCGGSHALAVDPLGGPTATSPRVGPAPAKVEFY